jgi:putative membrane protein insertion efficiency factor
MHRSQISKLNTLPCSPAAAIVLGLLRLYKVLLSPLFAGSCRFYPSCADYMREAIELHGAVKGVWMGARRLVRCHPLGSHGVDPVPRP